MPAKFDNAYVVDVEYCQFMDEYFIKFPEELISQLDWCEGDSLSWECLDGKTIVVKKEEEN